MKTQLYTAGLSGHPRPPGALPHPGIYILPVFPPTALANLEEKTHKGRMGEKEEREKKGRKEEKGEKRREK